MALRLALATGLVPLLAFDGSAASRGKARKAAEAHPVVRESDSGPSYARGRLIVRYRNSVKTCVHCLLAHGESFADAVRAGGERLEELHRGLGAVSATPLFRPAEHLQAAEPGGVSVAELRQAQLGRLAEVKARFSERSHRVPAGVRAPALHHVYLLQVAKRTDLAAAAKRLARNRHVAYAEPDHRYEASALPNDPYFQSAGSWGQSYDDLWALKADMLGMPRAWNLSRGRGVVVAVVDTGVQANHEDLADNMWRNEAEIPDNGVDDDRNGFVDDVLGWNFANRRNGSADDHGHGTHVAGTIAAVGDNGVGIVGVAPRARIMAVKGLDRWGIGFSARLAKSIVYAAANGADVINNSWGCSFCPRSRVLEDAVRTAYGLGTVVVFSAGNSARGNHVSSPQNLRDPKPIVVAATNPRDEPTYFTSSGPAVDVAAPGGGEHSSDSNVLSARLRDSCNACREQQVGNKYILFQGTSMAAPHAAGLAALVISRRPELSADEVRHVLRGSSDDLQGPGFDPRTGAGRINAPRALNSGSPLEVRIVEPLDSSLPEGGTLSVRGTAAGPGLARHQLFGRRPGDGAWIPLNEPTPSASRGAELARLPAEWLELGWNLLRLVATTTDGRSFDDVVGVGRQLVRRRVARNLPGLPISPDISGTRIVWLQIERPYATERGHVYLFDTATRKLQRLSKRRVREATPRISGNRVVWDTKLRNAGRGGRFNTFTCTIDPDSGSCDSTILGRPQTGPGFLDGDGGRPVLSGGLVGLVGTENGARFRVLDVASGQSRKLGWTTDRDIQDGRVAVTRSPFGDSTPSIQVLEWETGEKREIRLARGEFVRGLALHGDSVIYCAGSWDEYAGMTLRQYDLRTDRETVLIDNADQASCNLDRFEDTVVWTRASDVEAYHVGTGRRITLALHPLAYRPSVAISGDTITWIDQTHRFLPAGQLYYARLPAGWPD